MNLTVEEALNIYPLKNGKLVAGASGLQRTIQSVNVMDAPDISKWLKHNQLLLTTAFVFKGYPEAVADLIQKLHKAGCTALGIKLGRYWREIPEYLINTANELGFPLIALPFEYTFSDIMEGLYRTSFNEEVRELNLVIEKQKKLINLAHSHSIDSGVYEELASILEYPIVIMSRQGYVLFNTTKWSEAFWKGKVNDDFEMKLIGYHETKYFQVPIHKQGILYGYLMILVGENTISKEEKILFQNAGEVLPRYMESKKQHSYQEEWLTDLTLYLQNQLPLGTLLSSFDRFGIELPFQQYQCVLTTISNGEIDSFWDIQEKLEFDRELQGYGGFHFPIRQSIFSIYPVSDRKNRALGESLVSVINSQGVERSKFFVSRIKNQPAQLQEAYQECIDMQMRVATGKYTETLFYEEDLEIYQLVKYIPENVLNAYSEKILGPLRHSEEMIQTLELFLEYNGQVNEVAKRLFVHRNTVTYRMEKINTLLNIEFRNYNDILKLKLVFLAYKRNLYASGHYQ